MGRIYKLILATNIRLVSFEGKVEGKTNGVKYVPDAPKGFVWVDYPYIKRAIKSGVDYLVINYRDCDEKTEFQS